MNILGISCFYHESAAALIIDGKIIAASAEERFSRIKHDSSFPKTAIDFCLEYGRIKSADLEYVAFYEKPFLKFERNLMTSLRNFPNSLSLFVDSMKNFLTEKLWVKSIIAEKLKINPEKILFIPHHLSHAAASFYPSPFKEAAFLTLDGVGEWTTGSWGMASGDKFLPMGEMKFPNSVGLLYSTFTAFLGFEVNDGEYKVMGMAGYGKPEYVAKIKKLYKQYNDGLIKLNLDYFAFHKSSKRMYSEKFIREFGGLGGFGIAASLQKCTEEIVFNMLNFIYKKTKQKYLVYGGGVALNSVINGKIPYKTSFKDLFIFPASGDDGGAVGAALYAYHHVLGHTRRYSLDNVFLGQEFKILNLKFRTKHKITEMKDRNLIDYIAGRLAEGKVIGWFEGRAEFGPRALGHRSILADPRNVSMKNKVNLKVKFREEFRPFAPAVLEEYTDQYFQGIQGNLGKFMLGTFKVRPKTKKIAPAIVHVDGTSRIQIVSKNYSGKLRKLLKSFYKKTGVPILLNTSFNLQGEPIVNSPEDALSIFHRSGLDILVLENSIIEKNHDKKVS